MERINGEKNGENKWRKKMERINGEKKWRE